MRCRSASEPGSPGRPNEDYVGVADAAAGRGGVLVLLDGVTAPASGGGCDHGVAWFSARLGGALLQSCGRAGRTAWEAPLTACLAEAIAGTAGAHGATCDLSHPRTPQATVVCARWDARAVEYLVLSDSVLLVQAADGAVRAVLDDRLAALAPAARRLPAGERGAFVEARRNREDGFFTAAADPAVAALAVTGTVERDGVRALAALSDGVGRWVETFRFGDWPALFDALAANGPAAVIDRVRAAESADPEGVAFPRGKVHDDATAVVVELGDAR
ncbi:hypothetical protein ACTWP5_24775 [Streptomyces sp. 4N509B]|uniref:hypothetical protein n=1 Tax=Streptomyces sp. 4N509B TaxID=3457413 RepID=UPI003FD3BB05